MSNNLLDLLKGQISPDMIGQIAQNLNVDSSQASTAVSAILPSLLGGLMRNAQSEQGASALYSALDRDHDGSVLDDLMGFVTNTSQSEEVNPTNNKIIDHIFQNDRAQVENSLASSSGLGLGNTVKLLTTLAPVVLGFLGRQKTEQGLDVSGLAQLLFNQRPALQQTNTAQESLGLLGLLDSNKDGNLMDDIGGLLSNFLKK